MQRHYENICHMKATRTIHFFNKYYCFNIHFKFYAIYDHYRTNNQKNNEIKYN